MGSVRHSLRHRPAVGLVLFLVVALLAHPLAAVLVGLLGFQGAEGAPAFGAAFALLLLVATVAMARLSGLRLEQVGLTFRGRRLLELAGGFLASAVLFTGLIVAVVALVGARWEASARPDFGRVARGVLVVLCLFASEELLFRGFAFRQIAALTRPSAALATTAVAFGLYHLIGSGATGMDALFRFLTPAAGGAVFAFALIRSGGLALPIGLHWGGNWIQHSILAVTGDPRAGSALWVAQLTSAQAGALNASTAERLPYFVVLALLVLLIHTVVPRSDYGGPPGTT